MREPERVVVSLSLDVEEEGLFSGAYACQNPRISNTAHLARLEPFLERGIKPTLFCAWSAFTDRQSRQALEKMRDRHGAEIAAHLHHWNTPPLVKFSNGSTPDFIGNVASGNVTPDLLAAKFKNLFQVAQTFQGAPLDSFRMGRWDLHRSHWPLLAENGVICDASVRPLHHASNGPDHFHAPANPYIAYASAQRGILEIPLTVTPLATPLGSGFPSLPDWLGFPLRQSLKNWGALALLPVEHPLWLLKLTTMLHIRRGGKVLSLTWHSSEMMPKGAPHMPSQEAVTRFLNKMLAYFDWLQNLYNPQYMTMSEIARSFAGSSRMPRPGSRADWTALEPA